MYIHFAFGRLGKKELLDEQSDNIIEKILKKKRLKITQCKEFIPILPSGSSRQLDLTKAELTDNVLQISTEHTIESPGITYLPEDVRMICFINISFKKLKNSPHSKEYGKFGICFTKEFYKRNNVKKVNYYTEDSVLKDPMIKRFNEGQGKLSPIELKLLEKEITIYRKPAKLFENFLKSATLVASIKNNSNDSSLNFWVYDRYPPEYDFRNENEYRIAFDTDQEYLNFNEEDIFMLIVPNENIYNKINQFLNQNWSKIPEIRIFPE